MALKLTEYQQSLVLGWEDVFKQGQLTLWIALSLKDGPKHMSEIRDFIRYLTGGTIQMDDRSIYRSLRRYYAAEIVNFKTEPTQGGPERKIYNLTPTGHIVLNAFCKRNIVNVLYTDAVVTLIKKGLQ